MQRMIRSQRARSLERPRQEGGDLEHKQAHGGQRVLRAQAEVGRHQADYFLSTERNDLKWNVQI